MRHLSFVLLLVLFSNSSAGQKAPAKAESKVSDEQKQSVVFKSLAQMNELIDLGVPALALSLMDDEQGRRAEFSADWYSFEYKRITLLSRLEHWDELIERTQWLFATAVPERQITEKIRLWFETQQVIARLQLKQSRQALDQLQRLLWTSTLEYRDPSLPAVWRRLVIRAYLQMQQEDDARKALVKYERDYQTSGADIDWVLLQAQVLLNADRPDQALQILQKVESEDEVDINALILIAQLQSNPKNAQSIYKKMREQLAGQVLSKPERWAILYVAYHAAKILADQPAQVLNLESLLSLDIRYPVFDESFQVSADELWELYNHLGLAIANDNGLLFGNDETWAKLSDKLIKGQPEKALQLNAASVLHTENFSIKQHQHKTIVEILEKRVSGLELINKLYLHSSKVSDVSVLPDEVRYRLVDYALAEGHYYEAATLMKSLKEPPDGKTVFDWRMRKARVLILQGEYDESDKLIRKTFIEKPKISRAELDRYIQVLFDLQTVQQHEQAIKLFDLLYIEGLNEKLKREIYFWKAESYFSLAEYDHAALFYLKSGSAVTDAGNDLWAQSARFKAGKSLMLAKIYDDAEKIYTQLLSITNSDTRKALINQNLQKIRLLKSNKEKNKTFSG